MKIETTLREFAKSDYLWNSCRRLWLSPGDIRDRINQYRIEEVNESVYILMITMFYLSFYILLVPWLTLLLILFISTLVVAIPQGLLLGIFSIKDQNQSKARWKSRQ
jgi:hypothetical protein